jgi:predicted DNA-binding transcriptional regulator AlpA
MTKAFHTSKQIKARYDISDMSLWRWLQDEKLNFPKPVVIRARRYWDAEAIDQWEQTRAAETASA